MTSEPANPWLASRARGELRPGDEYDLTYERRAAAGENVHGEADCITATGVRSLLDAGCGTGRIGRELARRGLDVVGVDLDEEMLATARRKAPSGDWRLGDLATIDLGRTFEAVLLAGNVMIFLTPGSEGAVLENLSRHLAPGGLLIAGFQLNRALGVAAYDALSATAGLALAERWATWQRDPWRAGGDYAVSVHSKVAQ